MAQGFSDTPAGRPSPEDHARGAQKALYELLPGRLRRDDAAHDAESRVIGYWSITRDNHCRARAGERPQAPLLLWCASGLATEISVRPRRSSFRSSP